MKGVRKLEKCNKLSREIQERNKRKRDITDGKAKRKTKGDRSRIKSRGREVYEE